MYETKVRGYKSWCADGDTPDYSETFLTKSIALDVACEILLAGDGLKEMYIEIPNGAVIKLSIERW